jgi:predicted dehydrogenase
MGAATLRIGLVGARSRAFVAGLRGVPGVEVAALCDIDPAVLARYGDQLGIEHRYAEFERLLESQIDAVVVGTPMHLHVPQSIAALEAGKHVLCEVTAAVDVEQCRALVAAARRSGRHYMLSENYCYRRQTVLVGALVRAGLLGEPYYAEGGYIHNCRHLHADAEGRPTWRTIWQVGKNGCTYGTHSLGPVLQWLDDRVATVACFGSGRRTEPKHGMDDTVTMICTTTRGAQVSIRCDMLSSRPHNMIHYALQGTTGAYLAGRHPGEEGLVWLKDRSPDPETWEPLERYAEYLPDSWRRPPPAALAAGHGGGDYFIVRDWIEAIRRDEPPPIDVFRGLDFTLPGLISEESIARGGVPLPVPDPRAW